MPTARTKTPAWISAPWRPSLLEPGVPRLVPTGLRIELPPGYEAQIRPRSGLALKHAITLPNAPPPSTPAIAARSA